MVSSEGLCSIGILLPAHLSHERPLARTRRSRRHRGDLSQEHLADAGNVLAPPKQFTVDHEGWYTEYASGFRGLANGVVLAPALAG
jgi:hypothetical protein